jgi:hypothetical protein
MDDGVRMAGPWPPASHRVHGRVGSPRPYCGRTVVYTRTVRSALAVLLALLLVAATTADRMACPDGCTDEPPGPGAAPEAPSTCALCHGWSGSPVTVASRPIPTQLQRDALEPPPTAAPDLPGIEHPPKSA